MAQLHNHEEPTNFEILTAINKFATYVEGRFQQIDQRFEGIEKNLILLRSDLNSAKSSMVTKAYLDDKLADLQADLGMRIHKVDAKLNKLVEIQKKKKILTPKGSYIVETPRRHVGASLQYTNLTR